MPKWDEIFKKKEVPRKVINIDTDLARKRFTQDGILDYLDRRRGTLKQWDKESQ